MQFKKRLIERFERGSRLAIQGDEKHTNVTIHYKPIRKDYRPIRTKISFGAKKDSMHSLKTSSPFLGEMKSLNLNPVIPEKKDTPKKRYNPHDFSRFESRTPPSIEEATVIACTATKVQSRKQVQLYPTTSRAPCAVAGSFKPSADIVRGGELSGARGKGAALLGPFDIGSTDRPVTSSIKPQPNANCLGNALPLGARCTPPTLFGPFDARLTFWEALEGLKSSHPNPSVDRTRQTMIRAYPEDEILKTSSPIPVELLKTNPPRLIEEEQLGARSPPPAGELQFETRIGTLKKLRSLLHYNIPHTATPSQLQSISAAVSEALKKATCDL